MSLIIKNLDAAAVEVDDIGIRLEIGATYDLTDETPQDIATSNDLVTLINAGDLIVLDPLDDVTQLTVAQSVKAVQGMNDSNFRIIGGEVDQLDNIDAATPNDEDILQFNTTSGKWEAGANPGAATTFLGLSDTPGAYTGNGSYFVKVNAGANGLEFVAVVNLAIDDLSDVVITAPADNEVLAYDNGGGDFINQTAAEAGLATSSDLTTHTTDATIHFTEASIDHTNILNIGTNTHAQIDTHIADVTNPHNTSLDLLSNVTITTPIGDHVLVYDGANWINTVGVNSNGISGTIVVTAAYTADDKVFIKVDTTTGAVIITLPLASSFTNKFFHIKWIAGLPKNKVTILAQIGEFIDDETGHIMGQQYDSLNMVSDGTNWWII